MRSAPSWMRRLTVVLGARSYRNPPGFRTDASRSPASRLRAAFSCAVRHDPRHASDQHAPYGACLFPAWCGDSRVWSRSVNCRLAARLSRMDVSHMRSS
jgi:hypothetical protein